MMEGLVGRTSHVDAAGIDGETTEEHVPDPSSMTVGSDAIVESVM
jgi:hypothetical protein